MVNRFSFSVLSVSSVLSVFSVFSAVKYTIPASPYQEISGPS